MNKVIWKYTLTPEKLMVSIPEGATILTAHEQRDEICIWAEVNPKNKLEVRTFEIFGTGHTMQWDMGVVRKYIGTAYILDFVFHVYERIN